MNLSKNILNEKFEYVDGNLIWKKAIRKDLNGRIAGTLHPKGYKTVFVCGKAYLLHRLIFLYHYGYLPLQVDHIDTNKANNKIENLRESSESQNRCNSQMQQNNTSGYKNISWDKSRNKWHVAVALGGKTVFSKRFNDLDEAIVAAREARQKYHGVFARHV
jgi:hypothetical protein